MTIKRFIAGAICPSCNNMDTTKVSYMDDQGIKECVDCGFSEKIIFSLEDESKKLNIDNRTPQKENQQTDPVEYIPIINK